MSSPNSRFILSSVASEDQPPDRLLDIEKDKDKSTIAIEDLVEEKAGTKCEILSLKYDS